jgi:mono/diheme cytochrome c family protein
MRPEQGYTIEVQQMGILPKKLWLRVLLGLGGVFIVLIVVLALVVSLRWDRTFDYPVQDVTVSMDPANIARGEYLYKSVSVCGACHSVGGEENPDLLPAGGRKFDIPVIGVIYTPNITPAMETGIGGWTDGEVIRAIREGIGKNGRFLVLMPSELFVGMSDEDVQAIVAFLRSQEPNENETPKFKPSLVGRLFLSFLMSPPDRITEPVAAPPRGPTEEYGKYLANHVSPCAACHTPRIRGEIVYDKLWSGGEGFEVGESTIYSANLTRDAETGIGS